jgi:hypothetical protein
MTNYKSEVLDKHQKSACILPVGGLKGTHG